MAEIRIPKIGMSAVDVEVTEVHVGPGQHVTEGQPLLDVAADKVDFTIESTVSGTVGDVLAHEGDVCDVGQVVVLITEEPAS
jgi:pyruvate/2-oxoglutarate dehydrogenase complex dihydrolipoamide acyltransferase (E2) component